MAERLAGPLSGTGDGLDMAVISQETFSTPDTVGASLAGKIHDKHQSSRRKGLEKSVLDDIMGDPEDFRDLADSDAESDGGRWEDTVRETLGGADLLEGSVAQMDSLEMEGHLILERVLERSETKGQLHFHSTSNNKMLLHTSIKDGEISSQKSSVVHSAVAKEKIQRLPDGNVDNKFSISTRYFIIKSLNHHNITKSIQKGIWATQAMNESILNDAFESSERVILIFSVNMSGHFQGYAQMTSPIGQRKTNVWNESNNGSHPWGGSFSVEWLRMYDLPFQKTVHLKNPLNSFKPVKISRDCQELTQDIGEALCALIDEGAENEGKSKRKLGTGDAPLTKRSRGEKSSFPLSGSYESHLLTTSVKGPIAPMYSTIHVPSMSHETYNLQLPIIGPPGGLSTSNPAFFKHLQSEKPRSSPRRLTTEKDLHCEKDRDRGSFEGRDQMQGREDAYRANGSNHTEDLPPEEDFLNMTYEEYLQHHGKSREYSGHHQATGCFSSYLSAPLYGSGWTGNSGMGYSDDQYSNYLAKWYSQQGLVMSGECYFATGTISNLYSGIRPT